LGDRDIAFSLADTYSFIMPRPDRSPERRAELLPTIAKAFAELGYRRATTAQLAAACDVQEVVLYRLWPDKKAMFLAALEHVYDASLAAWEALLTATDRRSAAERLLEYEADHHGEFGFYRLLWAGLSDADDPDIRTALARLYTRYHEFIVRRLREHRGKAAAAGDVEPAAWALIGLGTITSVGKELGLLGSADRRALWHGVGPVLLGKRRR
jgi:AcrR family transcriptional regulator